MEKNNKIIYRLATAIYIILIFLFTSFARKICVGLKNMNILGPVVSIIFAISFIISCYYLFFKVKLKNVLSYVGLALVIAILAYIFKGIEYPEEKIHFLEFGMLAILFKLSMSDKQSVFKQYLLTFIFTSFVGVMDEVFQFFLPTRVFDYRDISFNVLAGLMALSCYECIHNNLFIAIREKIKIKYR